MGLLEKSRPGILEKHEGSLVGYVGSIWASLKAAQPLTRGKGLWIWPVDEPNDAHRRGLAATVLDEWKRAGGFPVMVTENWQTAGILPRVDHIWVGAGDYPSFGAAATRGITGFYTGLDGRDAPIRFRYLAGLHAWAGGFREQAYWHYDAISGAPDSDFDGKQEDFLAADPESPPDRPWMTVHVTEVSEGIQDLRLLCALDSLPTTSPVATETRQFLAQLKASVTPTDRPPGPWRDPAAYEQMRAHAVSLWSRHSRR